MIDPYDLALIVLGTLVVLLAAALLWRRMRTAKPSSPSYTLRAEPFTEDERTFLPRLQEAFGDEFALFTRFPLDALLEPTASSTRKRRRAAEGLQGRSIPFLLCRRGDLAPVAAIVPVRETQSPLPELDACDLAVLRIAASPAPSPRVLRTELKRLLGDAEPQVTRPAAEQEDDWRIGAIPPQGEEERGWLDGIAPAPPAAPLKEAQEANKEAERGEGDAELLCPECGTPMTRRRMVRGPHAGREIWVCANFPSCRKTVPVLTD